MATRPSSRAASRWRPRGQCVANGPIIPDTIPFAYLHSFLFLQLLRPYKRSPKSREFPFPSRPSNGHPTHYYRRTSTIAMMLHVIWIFVLVCHITSVSSVSQHTVASWVAPSCSSRNALPCSRGKATTRASSPPPLNLAVQDKILEGLRMKWGNNLQSQTQNDINGNNRAPPLPSPKQRIPFVIQKIGRGKKSEIEEITRLCIDVFFNQPNEDGKNDAKQTNNDNNGETNKKQVPPWKALQLAYLRNFQEGDILARNAFKKDQLVDLIVARRIYPVSDATNMNGDKVEVIEDESQICNLDQLSTEKGSREGRYTTGEIIGYSEISEKKFGLGGDFETGDPDSPGEKPRPYLSNLSVVEYARESGVGSRLVDACEAAVRGWDAGHTEMVLQVEEDNTTAIQFYKRRGWEFVFADPTCRRYDTSGFFLRSLRITKYAMIKRLDTPATDESDEEEAGDSGSSLMDKLRSSFFVK